MEIDRAFLERTLSAMEGVIDVADRKTDEFDEMRACIMDLTLMLYKQPKKQQEPQIGSIFLALEAVHPQFHKIHNGALIRRVIAVCATKEAAENERAKEEEEYHKKYPGYRQYGGEPHIHWITEEMHFTPAATHSVPEVANPE